MASYLADHFAVHLPPTQLEIQKDTGSGWQFLALDTRPNYTDTTPFPTPAATWKYRAICCEDSQKLGQWSNVAEISVRG